MRRKVPVGTSSPRPHWNRPVGSEDEVEEWRAGDSDNEKGADANGEPAEVAAHATGATVDANAEADDEADAKARTEEEAEADADAVAPADVAAIADSDADAVAEANTDAAEGGADAVLFDGEKSDDDPWNITAPEEEDEMRAEGMREVSVASGLDVLYQETPNYRGAAAEADRMIKPRETARHAWRVLDLDVREPVLSAGEEAVTE
ncbi:unnamed protein product [Closterium sp. NIES-53]